jgi:putative Ca2+/H+ antiporter (TMEM165/GDT1 family)
MDWRLLLTTFASVFLAELGDKTQLATFSFACGSRSVWTVFAGSALALVTSSALACLVGGAVSRVVPARWLHLGAGLLFIVLGALLVIRTFRPAS